MAKVFLCHSTTDKPFVHRLWYDLKHKGVNCWIDDYEIKVGDSLREKIEEGISESDYLAIVLSNNSIKSSWVGDLPPLFVPPLKLEIILTNPHLTINISIYPDV